MAQATISGLRGVELAVHDLKQSTEFYRRVWGLEAVSSQGDTVHLRGTGREHHVVTLREQRGARLLAQRDHVVLAACAAQMNRIALRRNRFKAPNPAVEFCRLLEIMDGELDTTQSCDCGLSHGVNLRDPLSVTNLS